MRCHYNGTSSEEIKCQFVLALEPFWAWVCWVLDAQDSIKELFNCVLACFDAVRRICPGVLRTVGTSVNGPFHITLSPFSSWLLRTGGSLSPPEISLISDQQTSQFVPRHIGNEQL